MLNIEMTIERDEMEISVIVELEYEKASRGYRNSYGVPEEPDYPESFEVFGAKDENGVEYELTKGETEQAIELAFDERQSAKEDAAECRAQARIEARYE